MFCFHYFTVIHSDIGIHRKNTRIIKKGGLPSPNNFELIFLICSLKLIVKRQIEPL